MVTMQQLSFYSELKLFHGGRLRRGKRKVARPIATNRAIRHVLKAKDKSVRSNRFIVGKEMRRLAKKFGVKIYSFAVNFNHAHFVARFFQRRSYVVFIRGFTSCLAQKLGA